MAKKIVVVGSINIDIVASVPRMPEPGETLTGGAFATYSGGKGANQAVGAARLGGDVVMIGRLGNDLFAERLRQELQAAGVDIQHVDSTAHATGSAIILVTADGGNSIVVVPGANEALRAEDVESCWEVLRDAGVILAQLEIPLATVIRLVEIAQELKVPIILDPAPAQLLPRELLQKVTWLTPNETESEHLLRTSSLSLSSSEESTSQLAKRLLDMGPRNVILKLGGRGVYLAGQDVEPTFIPSFQVEALDTTAAGDAFNGGFAYALMQSMSPVEAARFACAVAAISVTRSGAQPSMPRLGEVEELLTDRRYIVDTSG